MEKDSNLLMDDIEISTLYLTEKKSEKSLRVNRFDSNHRFNPSQVGGINYQQGGNFQGAGSQPATAYCNRRKRAAFFDQLELSELIAPSETRP